MLALPPAVSAQTDPQAPPPAPPPAQTPPQSQTPPPVEAPAVQTPPAPARAESRIPRPETRRHSIRLMEAVLSRAVLGGAEQLAEQLGNGSPNMSFFTGQARAHGFLLDGYGVFFHVEIPEMQQSLVMSVTTLERDEAVASTLESLRRAVNAVPEGAPKLQAEEILKRLELQIGPMPAAAVADARGAAGRNMIRTADTTTQVADVAPVPLPLLRDPSSAYREAIKSALIDAMLEHSRGMDLQPDEWLTVAAHRGESPLGPNEIVTSSTLVLRVKGSDLALYDTDRSRKDEVRKRVETREF
jgi:hypothetical protein